MRSNGVFPVFSVTIRSDSKSLKTLALCNSGASMSYVDENLKKALHSTGQVDDLIVAGTHGTSDISSKRIRVKIGDQD